MRKILLLMISCVVIMCGVIFSKETCEAAKDYEKYSYDEIMSDDVSSSAITVTFEEVTMEKGERLRLHHDMKPSKVVWECSDNSIAKVSDGYVKAIKKGNVLVTGIYKDTAYEWEIEIKPKSKNAIYLTFDDGPSLTSTPKVLDILKKHKVKATFFVINYDKRGAKLIKRADREGHTIAIHGYSHNYASIYKSEAAYMKNVTSLQKKLNDLIGYDTWLTRFPGGSSNMVSRNYNKGIMRRLVKKVDKAGFSYFDWNVSSGDASTVTKTSEQVYRNVTRSLKKNQDNIVLMHDFSGNYKTINALERIIKYAKKKGFTFKAITDSTAQIHHNLNN